MPEAALPLGLEERHFEAWLELWRRQCRVRFGETEAGELIALAEGIGQRLRAIVASKNRYWQAQNALE